jgi:hypothetical protein
MSVEHLFPYIRYFVHIVCVQDKYYRKKYCKHDHTDHFDETALFTAEAIGERYVYRTKEYLHKAEQKSDITD